MIGEDSDVEEETDEVQETEGNQVAVISQDCCLLAGSWRKRRFPADRPKQRDAVSQVTYRCALGHCVGRAYLRPRSPRPGGAHADTGAGFIGCSLGRRPDRANRFMEGLKMAKKTLKKGKKLKGTKTPIKFWIPQL